jgi:hypothetical protein
MSRRTWRLSRVALAALLAASSAAAEPTAGSPARGVDGAAASEIWTLVGRFAPGYDVVAEIAITNLGPGEDSAAVIGHVVDPEGRVHPFRKAKREGHWDLSPDGLRIEVGPIAFDQHPPDGRLQVDRDTLRLDIRFAPLGRVRAPESLMGPDRGLEITRMSSAATARLKTPEMEQELALEGHVGVTHRWAEGQAEQAGWRLELFDVDRGIGLFLTGPAEPDAPLRGWLVAERPGEPLRQTSDFEAVITWQDDPDADEKLPAQIDLEGPQLTGRVRLERPMLRYDPFGELPAPVRWLLALELRMRSAWDAASFELTWKEGGTAGPLRLSGRAVVGVTQLEPGALAANPIPPPVAAPASSGGAPR